MTSAVSTDVSPSTFEGLSIDPRLIDAVGALGFESPTPIQAEAIPPLVSGRDVIGRARTGSGKTAAFGLPVLERVKGGGKAVKALLLCPTRELALQVTDALRSYAAQLPVRVVTLYGGASYGPQLKALSKGVSVVVGTPGRVLDHLERGTLDLSELELFVLDEADEMLRMGFIDDVEKLLSATPKGRQVALFSATMPPPIERIAKTHLKEPLVVQVESEALTTEHIQQRGVLVPHRFKLEALRRVLAAEPRGATLVFARTRAGCAEAATYLAERGLRVDALHGDLNQGARELVVTRLRAGQLDVVVATDVAARGLDVDLLTHVVNLDLPTDPETYVHRIGRTGRAGRDGTAISFVAPAERGRVRRFEDTLGVRIARMDVPSDADILAARRTRLTDAMENAAPEPAHLALADALLAGGGDAREALASALKVMADDRGFDLAADASEEPPSWSRPRERAPKQSAARPAHRPASEEKELFLPLGKRRGVRPGDLVGALANELGIPSADIGRITVGANASFVRVPVEVAEHLIQDVGRIQIRGVEVPLVEARPSRHPRAQGRPSGRPQQRPRPFRPKKRR